MKTFCTIITTDFAYYAIAQYRSFSRYCGIPMHVLCVDRLHDVMQEHDGSPGLTFHFLDTLRLDESGKAVVDKNESTSDALRWSLKSVWVRYLLENGIAEQVIFIDPDIYFFHNPEFLFDILGDHAILLSPHWRSTDPTRDASNFEMNFRDGIYNGGFLGATKAGLAALQWITSACLYKCEVKPERGLYYDQRYYDLLYSRFPGVVSLQHKGCNVANWNQIDCKRVASGNQVLINGTDPVVFIHFTKSTILGIRNGSDPLLTPFLDEYEASLRSVNPLYVPLSINADAKQDEPKTLFQRLIRRLKS